MKKCFIILALMFASISNSYAFCVYNYLMDEPIYWYVKTGYVSWHYEYVNPHHHKCFDKKSNSKFLNVSIYKYNNNGDNKFICKVPVKLDGGYVLVQEPGDCSSCLVRDA